MSLFGVLANARGHRLLASGAVQRRRSKRLPAERLAAERLAGVLELLSAASPAGSPGQPEGGDTQQASGARQPRHARALPTAPSVTDPVNSAKQVLAPEVLAPEVLAPEGPGAGRHRRPGVQPDVDSAHLIPALEVLPLEVPGTGRHRRPGVSAVVDWAHPNPAPAIATPAVPDAGHHRRSGFRTFLALRVAPPRAVLLGVLVLLVALAAVVLGVRGSGALESAQPPADAATSHSAAVTVPGTR